MSIVRIKYTVFPHILFYIVSRRNQRQDYLKKKKGTQRRRRVGFSGCWTSFVVVLMIRIGFGLFFEWGRVNDGGCCRSVWKLSLDNDWGMEELRFFFSFLLPPSSIPFPDTRSSRASYYQLGRRIGCSSQMHITDSRASSPRHIGNKGRQENENRQITEQQALCTSV